MIVLFCKHTSYWVWVLVLRTCALAFLLNLLLLELVRILHIDEFRKFGNSETQIAKFQKLHPSEKYPFYSSSFSRNRTFNIVLIFVAMSVQTWEQWKWKWHTAFQTFILKSSSKTYLKKSQNKQYLYFQYYLQKSNWKMHSWKLLSLKYLGITLLF